MGRKRSFALVMSSSNCLFAQVRVCDPCFQELKAVTYERITPSPSHAESPLAMAPISSLSFDTLVDFSSASLTKHGLSLFYPTHSLCTRCAFSDRAGQCVHSIQSSPCTLSFLSFGQSSFSIRHLLCTHVSVWCRSYQVHTETCHRV